MATMNAGTFAILRRLCGFFCFFCIAILAATQSRSAESDDGIPPLIRDMVGTWNVEQWMWPGAGMEAIALPPAAAHRKLFGNNVVQETMSALANSHEPFTRVSYFGYNLVERRYEYFSLDSRAPQMMNQASNDAKAETTGAINLLGGTFLARQWGPARNVTFRYRLLLGRIEDDRQTVELYLTPASTDSQQEFLAFRYLYTRQR